MFCHLGCSKHFKKAMAGATWGHDAGVWMLCGTEVLRVQRHGLPAELFLPGSPISPLLPSKTTNESALTQMGFSGIALSVMNCTPDQKRVLASTPLGEMGGMKHKVEVWLTQIQTVRQRHEQSWNRALSSLIALCGCRQTALPLNCVFRCIITCLLAS